MAIILEDSDSGLDAPTTAREGSIANIRDAISSFNGCDRTMLTLRNTSTRTLLMVGGKADALIVSWQHDHGDPPYMTLRAAKPIGRKVELVIGQLADYDGEVVVTRAEANDAIEEFVKTGKMTPLHQWRED